MVQGYQEQTRQENRRFILYWIVVGSEGLSGPDGATFGSLRDLTDLAAPTLSSHLKALEREGLIELKHDVESDTLRYVPIHRKSELLTLLTYFIRQQKNATKEYKIEIERLERAAQDLKTALEPFGKLPKEIEQIWDEVDRARMGTPSVTPTRKRGS